MAIPKFKVFFRIVLEIVSEQGVIEKPRRTLVTLIKDKMSLTNEDMAETLKSGDNRL